LKVAITRNGRRIRGRLELPGEGVGENQRANGSEREPGQHHHSEQEDKPRVSVAGLKRLRSGLRGGGPDAELPRRVLEPVLVVLDPE